MPISFNCPKCRTLFTVPDELARTQAACGHCQQIVTVPAATVGVAAPAVVPVARPIAVAMPVAGTSPVPVARPIGGAPQAVQPVVAAATTLAASSTSTAREADPLDDALAGGPLSSGRRVHRRRKPGNLPAIIIGSAVGVFGLIALVVMIKVFWGGKPSEAPPIDRIAAAPVVPAVKASTPVASPLGGIAALPAVEPKPEVAPQPTPAVVPKNPLLNPDATATSTPVPNPLFTNAPPVTPPHERPNTLPNPLGPQVPNPTIPRLNNPNPFAPFAPHPDPLLPQLPPGLQTVRDDQLLPAQVPWEVKPDPSPTPFEIDPKRKITFRLPAGIWTRDILFADCSGPCLAIGSNDDVKDVCEFWDYSTKTRKGSLSGIRMSTIWKRALSPDGAHYAVVTGRGATNFVVLFATKTGKPLGELNPPQQGRIDWISFAGTGLLAYKYDKTLRVHKIPSGELAHEIDVGSTWGEQLQFSPGGKYLALSADRSIKFLSTESGELAGEINLPPGAPRTATTLSYSPDGAELAALYDQEKGQLYVFDLNDGTLASSLPIEEPISDRLKVGHSSKGNVLDWFPDKSGWLAYGRGIVDREVGLVYQLSDGFGTEGPRRVLDKNRILAIGGPKERPDLVSIDLPQAEIEKATDIVAAGGEIGDATLPPLTAARLSEADLLTQEDSAHWNVKPDPAPAAIEGLPSQIDLKGKAGTLRGMFLSHAGEGIVWYTAEDRPFGRAWFNPFNREVPKSKMAPTWADRYQLKTGKRLNTIEIPFFSEILALSPDGTRLISRGAGGDRLDVWNAADGKHVVGFRPYNKQHNFQRGVTAVFFLDATKLLTLNSRNLLVLWSLPECKPIYRMEGVSNPGVTPGGKYLVLSVGQKVRFFEAATGASMGDLAVGGWWGWWNGSAFHRDGTRFATVMYEGNDSKFVEWSLATGERINEGLLPRSYQSVQYAGDGYLLLGNRYLLDAKQQKIAWQFKSGMYTWHSPDSPDGRHWYLSQRSRQEPVVTLFAQGLPDPKLKGWLDNSILPDESVLKPGARVNLQVTVPGTQERPSLQEDVRRNFTNQLTNLGAVVAPDGEITLTVGAAMTSSGKTREYRTFGFGQENKTFSLNITSLDCTVTVSEKGVKRWERKGTFTAGDSRIETIPKNEDPNAYAAKRQWASAAEYLTAYVLPRQIFPEGAGQGIGESTLGY